MRPREDGFTLVESVVALGLAVIIFMALTFALLGGVHQVLLSQQNQQAGDILNQAVEKARGLSYDNLVMQSSDLNTGEATRTPTLSSCKCYNPKNDTTTGGTETLAYATVGGLVPHVSTLKQNGGTYTIRRYVTAPTDTAGSYKRLTIVVSWASFGRTHTRSYSTIVASTKRGLPLPDYKFTNVGSTSECRNPDSTAVYEFSVQNNGARDQWLITATPSSNPSWTFYADTDGDNAFDSSVDAALESYNGTPTTGLLDTNVKKTFFAVATVPSAGSATPPYTWTTSFTATSAALPAYYQTLGTVTSVQTSVCGGVSATPTPSTSTSASPTPSTSTSAPPTAPTQPAAPCTTLSTQLSGSAPGGTMVRYYMYNPTQPGDTIASQSMPVTRYTGTTPATGDLYNYSTDLLAANPGRYLNAPAGTNTTAAYLATWLYQMPGTSKLKGNGEVTFYARPASSSATAQPNFTAKLELVNGSTTTTLSTSTFSTPSTGWGCSGGYQRVSMAWGSIPNNTSVPANAYLRVSLSVSNSVPVVLGYGTATFPSEFSLPISSGNG